MAEVVVSHETLAELRQVLGRDRPDRFRDRPTRLEFFACCAAMTVLCPVTQAVVACRDPEDDKFLSLAVSAGASVLISSDNDWLTLDRIGGTVAIRPGQFVALCE